MLAFLLALASGGLSVAAERPGVISVASIDGTAASLTSGNWSSYEAIQALGYFAAGDGGGGPFRRVASCNLDHGTCFHDAARNYWRRRFSGPLNLLWFGADRTGATASTRAFNAMIAAAGVNATMIVPPGLYASAEIDRNVDGQTLEIRPGATIRRLPDFHGTLFVDTANNLTLKGDGGGIIDGDAGAGGCTDQDSLIAPNDANHHLVDGVILKNSCFYSYVTFGGSYQTIRHAKIIASRYYPIWFRPNGADVPGVEIEDVTIDQQGLSTSQIHSAAVEIGQQAGFAMAAAKIDGVTCAFPVSAVDDNAICVEAWNSPKLALHHITSVGGIDVISINTSEGAIIDGCDGTAPSLYGVELVNERNAKVSNCRIRGNGYTRYGLMASKPAYSASVDDNIEVDNYAVMGASTAAFQFQNINGIRMDNVTTTGANGVFDTAHRIRLSDVMIDGAGNAQVGILFENCSSGCVWDATIDKLACRSVALACIGFYETSAVFPSNVSVTNSTVPASVEMFHGYLSNGAAVGPNVSFHDVTHARE